MAGVDGGTATNTFSWPTFLVCLVAAAAFVAAASWLLDRFNRWSSPRWVAKALDDVRAGRTRVASANARPRQHRLFFDQAGFTIQPRAPLKGPDPVSWNKVQRAHAFKRDLLTTDCVCILFLDRDGVACEVDEEMEGWREFCDALPKFLPGCLPLEGWHWEVTETAFATNMKEIYVRTESKRRGS